jgi:isopropylmalate/homocitrate/citramalate synthase
MVILKKISIWLDSISLEQKKCMNLKKLLKQKKIINDKFVVDNVPIHTVGRTRSFQSWKHIPGAEAIMEKLSSLDCEYSAENLKKKVQDIEQLVNFQ